jgi:hypothetical protein
MGGGLRQEPVPLVIDLVLPRVDSVFTVVSGLSYNVALAESDCKSSHHVS